MPGKERESPMANRISTEWKKLSLLYSTRAIEAASVGMAAYWTRFAIIADANFKHYSGDLQESVMASILDAELSIAARDGAFN